MDFIEYLVGFLIGVLSSLMSSYLIIKSKARKENKLFQDLAGLWVEKIDGQPDRMFSIGDFRIDKSDGKYHYNGINFNDNGSIYYRWRSEKIFKDTDTDRVLYIYSVSEDGKRYTLEEGFGVSYFNKVEGASHFTQGYFLDANLKDEPRNIKFIKADKLAKLCNYDLSDKSERGLGKFAKRLYELDSKNGIPFF